MARVRVQVYGMIFEKEISDKLAYRLLMNLVPKGKKKQPEEIVIEPEEEKESLSTFK